MFKLVHQESLSHLSVLFSFVSASLSGRLSQLVASPKVSYRFHFFKNLQKKQTKKLPAHSHWTNLGHPVLSQALWPEVGQGQSAQHGSHLQSRRQDLQSPTSKSYRLRLARRVVPWGETDSVIKTRGIEC